jgi:hypothetical protein
MTARATGARVRDTAHIDIPDIARTPESPVRAEVGSAFRAWSVSGRRVPSTTTGDAEGRRDMAAYDEGNIFKYVRLCSGRG